MQHPFKLHESTVFFSFLRMVIISCEADSELVSVRILRKVKQSAVNYVENQKFHLGDHGEGILEAMIDRADFPAAYDVEILSRRGHFTMSCADLVEMERQEHAVSSLAAFLHLIEDWKRCHPGATPKLLDIGGRARSGYLLADHINGCDVTVLDILADKGVDVVADIHEMSLSFKETRFDFMICVSVFEHLVMPWKAAIEVNKVLADGGLALIQTHQTVGLHDIPWDYFRFSDQSWKGLFNSSTGFEIVKTLMNNFVRITPNRYFNVEPHSERMGGFYESSVIVRKIGPTALDWPVNLTSIVSTMYPA